MITYLEGDLFKLLPKEGKVVIPHICNNMGAWGAGFTRPLSKAFPGAERAYREAVQRKLGHVQFVYVVKGPLNMGQLPRNVVIQCDLAITIANMIAQNGLPTASNPHPLDYDALEKCMQTVLDDLDLQYDGIEVYCPKFGAGIARGDWVQIEQMIERIWEPLDVKVCVLPVR